MSYPQIEGEDERCGIFCDQIILHLKILLVGVTIMFMRISDKALEFNSLVNSEDTLEYNKTVNLSNSFGRREYIRE